MTSKQSHPKKGTAMTKKKMKKNKLVSVSFLLSLTSSQNRTSLARQQQPTTSTHPSSLFASHSSVVACTGNIKHRRMNDTEGGSESDPILVLSAALEDDPDIVSSDWSSGGVEEEDSSSQSIREKLESMFTREAVSGLGGYCVRDGDNSTVESRREEENGGMEDNDFSDYSSDWSDGGVEDNGSSSYSFRDRLESLFTRDTVFGEGGYCLPRDRDNSATELEEENGRVGDKDTSSYSIREKLESMYTRENIFGEGGYCFRRDRGNSSKESRFEEENRSNSVPPPLPQYGDKTTEMKSGDELSRDRGNPATESEDENGRVGDKNSSSYSMREKLGSMFRRKNVIIPQKGPQGRPVIYRYFGRSRSRPRNDSIPFILLGSSVDHWKVVGKKLASLGFNVMAVEPVMEENISGSKRTATDVGLNPGEGPELIRSVMDALRWKRAIIVGCDGYAVPAIDAAREIGVATGDEKDGIAGLVLCGDLAETERFVEKEELTSNICYLSFDHFLHVNIPCPCNVIWDGDTFALMKWRSKPRKQKYSSSFSGNPYGIRQDLRSVIIGGGAAPHRRLPENFAWVLTRFVEERLTGYNDAVKESISNHGDRDYRLPHHRKASLSRGEGNKQQYWLVAGRVFATCILYMSTAKISLHQYKNVCGSISTIKSQCNRLSTWQFEAIGFVVKVLIDDLQRKFEIIRQIRGIVSINSIGPEKVEVDPEKVDIDPEKVKIDPEKVEIDPQKVEIGPQKVESGPEVEHDDKEKIDIDSKEQEHIFQLYGLDSVSA